jgi:regulator of PEP synthase PpsR (kinase-PPPase family)
MMSDGISMPAIFVLSDSAGETGEAVVKAAIIQFFPLAINIRRVPFIQSRTAIDMAITSAKAANAVIVFTLVIPELRDYLMEQAFVHHIVSIDLLGPIISSLEKVLDRQARHEPGLIHQLDEEYFKKVEAVEFAVKYDDGKDSRGILKADIILLGVSRTSKTPLSMYLAHMSYKVANVPLVPELKPPEELFTIPSHKIIGLRISTEKLNEIRKERLKGLGLPASANYASVDRIEQESEYAHQLMVRLGCTVIDVSNKAVEETASIIHEIFHQHA